MTHSVGQPVLALYGTESDVKVKLAVGLKDGTGEDAYQLIAKWCWSFWFSWYSFFIKF